MSCETDAGPATLSRRANVPISEGVRNTRRDLRPRAVHPHAPKQHQAIHHHLVLELDLRGTVDLYPRPQHIGRLPFFALRLRVGLMETLPAPYTVTR